MKITYRPLPAIWPSGQRTPYEQRKGSPFRSTWAQTMKLLQRELKMLGVGWSDTVVFEAGYSEGQIRLDGQPRADARANDPAIVISFEAYLPAVGKMPLRYGCDTYTTNEANIRAIALALEALRAVDRYGVTKRGEQYQGWKALPPGSGATSGIELRMTREEAIAVLSGLLGATVQASELDNAYRMAARRAHPDAGGSREEWNRLQTAKMVLGL